MSKIRWECNEHRYTGNNYLNLLQNNVVSECEQTPAFQRIVVPTSSNPRGSKTLTLKMKALPSLKHWKLHCYEKLTPHKPLLNAAHMVSNHKVKTLAVRKL
jgi:hypothetical protein